VLLKFLLLERQRIALDEVATLLLAMPVFAAANRNHLQQTPQALADWAVQQLIRAGAAKREGEYLLNQEM